MNKDLAYIKLMLEDISTIADKTTSGNVSHNIATIKCDARKALECIDNQKEPVSEDLEEYAEKYGYTTFINECMENGVCDKNDLSYAFKAGAQWQHEQMEKNRLAACDRQTDEEREREQQFVDEIVIGKQRIPTYSDAIEYGIRWQQQQGVAEEAEINYWNQRGLSIRTDKSLEYLGYEEGDKVKIIIVKE